jgi:hypothetical protein
LELSWGDLVFRRGNKSSRIAIPRSDCLESQAIDRTTVNLGNCDRFFNHGRIDYAIFLEGMEDAIAIKILH